MEKPSDLSQQLEDMLKGSSRNEYINSNQRSFMHHEVFLDGDITEPANYRELLSILFNANDSDTVSLYINSSGGHYDTALAIVEGLKHTEARVTAVLIGACHSAASIISMYCHDVIVLDNAYSMIHTASFGSSGSTNNVKAQTEFTVKQIEKLLNQTYEGFLSKEELGRIKTGVELWFDAEEIRTRMISRAKFIKKNGKKVK